MKKLIYCTLFTIIGSMYKSSVRPNPPKVKTAKAKILVKSERSWDENLYPEYSKGQPELTVMEITIPANSSLPWHEHPYANGGYILKGTITVEDKSGHKKTYKAGDAILESVHHIHRGFTGNSQVKVIIVYSGIKGQPTSIPAPGEKKEY